MRRSARFLLGWRDDLDLRARWWHRLALVAVTGTALFATVAGFFIATEDERYRSFALADVNVDQSLRAFTFDADPAIADTIPTFLALPGRTGEVRDGVVLHESGYDLNRSICSADLAAHADAVLDHFKSHRNLRPDTTVEEMAAYIARATTVDTDGTDQSRRVCFMSEDTSSLNYVKFRPTLAAQARYYAAAVFAVIAFILAAYILACNLYYRGLIYIIYGSRRKSV